MLMKILWAWLLPLAAAMFTRAPGDLTATTFGRLSADDNTDDQRSVHQTPWSIRHEEEGGASYDYGNYDAYDDGSKAGRPAAVRRSDSPRDSSRGLAPRGFSDPPNLSSSIGSDTIVYPRTFSQLMERLKSLGLERTSSSPSASSSSSGWSVLSSSPVSHSTLKNPAASSTRAPRNPLFLPLDSPLQNYTYATALPPPLSLPPPAKSLKQASYRSVAETYVQQYQSNALLAAIQDGQSMDVLVYLMNRRGTGHLMDEALVLACSRNHPVLVAQLLHAGADIHFRKELALRTATTMNHLKMVRLLLERGAAVGVDRSELIVRYCSATDRLDMCRLLLEFAARKPETFQVALHMAVSQPSLVDVAEKLLVKSSLVGPDDAQLNFLLLKASQSGNLPMVRQLVARGADLHFQQERPLLSAIRGKHAKTVEYLALRGADINARSGYPLAAAVQSKDWDTFTSSLLAEPDYETLVRAIDYAKHIGFPRALGMLRSLLTTELSNTHH